MPPEASVKNGVARFTMSDRSTRTARSPVGVVARAEWRQHLRRRSFWLLLALFAALLLAAAGLNRTRQLAERDRQEKYQQLVRAQWEGQPERHPHRVAHYGTFAFKPPGPLAAFDPGVESYAGRSVYLEAHRQNATNFAQAGELSSAFRLGELSLAFVLQMILPLVAIVLGYRAMVDEAESGRLRLLLGQGVAPRSLMWGKLLGLAIALFPFVGLGLLVSGATLLTDPAFSGDSSAVARTATITVALALHTFTWLTLTIWVSVRATSAARACGALVMLWIATMILTPRAAGLVAEALHPLPDKSSFAAAVADDVRKFGDSHDPNDPHFAQFRQETLARHGVSRVEDLPVNYRAVVMAHGEDLSAQTFARHFAALAAKMEAQAKVIDFASFFTAPLAMRALSATASGTDLRAQLKFEQEAEAYRYGFVQKLNELHRDKVRYQGDSDQKISAEHWKHFADFRAAPLPLADALRGTAVSWFALLLWVLVPTVALLRIKPIIR